MVWNALNSVNPDLGYWMSEYYILHKNNEIGGGGRRNLTMKTALYVDRIIHTMVLPYAIKNRGSGERPSPSATSRMGFLPGRRVPRTKLGKWTAISRVSNMTV